MTVAPALLWLLPLIAWLLPWLLIAPRVGVLLAGEMDLPDDPTKSTSLPGELAESRTMPALTRRRATTPSGFTAAAIGGILGAWLCSPAAAILMPDKRAGSSTTATCTSARSGCDPA